MRCRLCGSPAAPALELCAGCRTRLLHSEPPLEAAEGAAAGTSGECERCGFRGRGVPYFGRGSNRVALFGATVLTLPFAFGAGGFLYYGLRHDHRICPRCGLGWGRSYRPAPGAVPALMRRASPARTTGTEGLLRFGTVLLLIFGITMLVTGPLIVGLIDLAGAGLLHRLGNRARAKRRQALIAELQLPVLRLAAASEGRLTVTQVATALGWTIPRAEKILASLDDGWRVNSQISAEGILIYEFRELLLGPGGAPDPGN